MTNQPDKKLIFKLGEESVPTVMTADQVVESPFADVVLNAKKRVECIANQLEASYVSASNENSSLKWLDSTPNNIVAFLGDRGAGKTSCMRTLVNLMKEDPETKKNERWLFTSEIDPSFFDEDHNVLAILIGSLYGMFKEDCREIEKKSQKVRNDLKTIQDKFREVKSAMKYLDKETDLSDEYEIDALKHLDEGGKIRMLLKNLISEILAFKEKKFLVLTIDDLDLNIKQSYVMMEHIRKFLIIPNVILIIAAKFTQLFDSVCLDLTKVYKGLEYRVSHKDIAEMAERYLNKIFPLDQRFEMPSADAYMNLELQIIDNDKTLYEKEDVKLTVPTLIFEKTRYLFYNSSGMPSLVIPRNLRDLRMLVSMLVKMEPYTDKTQKMNKRVFKDYFFNEWLGIIEPEYRLFAKSLLAEENLAKINRFVIKNLYDFFLSKVESYDDLKADIETPRENRKRSQLLREKELLYDILNPSNSYWNVSIGDVVFVINEVRKTYDAADVLSLLFFIESFYSMRLYESYDILTSMTDDDGLKMPIEMSSSAPELKTSTRGDVPEYFRLVGGGFFSPTGDFFTSLSQADNGISREYILLNGNLLMDFIHKVEKQYQELFPIDCLETDVNIPQEYSENLRFCEFFMLTIKFKEDSRSYGSKYRLANDPVYFKNFGFSSRYLVFDITMPFFNAIYAEFAYSRFGSRLYEYAKKDKDSLLNRMFAHNSRKKDNKSWEIMSKAAIRNMEILEDLTAWLHKNREDNKVTGADTMKVLQTFYNQFLIDNYTDNTTEDSEVYHTVPKGKYGVKTYGKTSGRNAKNYYNIDYSIYSELAKVVFEIDNPDYDVNDWMKSKNQNSHKDDNQNQLTIPGMSNTSTSKEDDELKLKRRKDLKALFNGIFSNNLIFLNKDEYSYDEVSEVLIPYFGEILVQLKLGNDHSITFSAEELAQILAEIRVEDRYEFGFYLPYSLVFYYGKFVPIEFDKRIKPLEKDKAGNEIKINLLNSEIATLTDANKKMRQEIVQYEKDLQKSVEEKIDLEQKMNEHENYMAFLSLKINSATDKTESTRLRKEEEKTMKLFLSVKAELDKLPKKEELYKKHISDAQSTISKNDENIENARKQKAGMENKQKQVVAELDEYNTSRNRPRQLELRHIY